jgi:hypothetical protein
MVTRQELYRCTRAPLLKVVYLTDQQKIMCHQWYHVSVDFLVLPIAETKHFIYLSFEA